MFLPLSCMYWHVLGKNAQNLNPCVIIKFWVLSSHFFSLSLPSLSLPSLSPSFIIFYSFFVVKCFAIFANPIVIWGWRMSKLLLCFAFFLESKTNWQIAGAARSCYQCSLWPAHAGGSGITCGFAVDLRLTQPGKVRVTLNPHNPRQAFSLTQ